MKDQEVVLTALNEAALIIGDYLEPGIPRDPVATINRLIEVWTIRNWPLRSNEWKRV
jgi:hypothetical protein